MTPDRSRRNFFSYVSGVIVMITAARNVHALPAPQQAPPTNGSGAQPPNHQNSGGQPPGPAQHGGDYQPPTISGPYDRRKDKEPPSKPRKDLVADQKSLRDDVQQLALDTQELSKAIAQFGPKQALPADLVDKTKEIERLAHDIAVLAKG